MGFLDSFKRTPTLTITMMGPRGVGKTTILTSIFSNAVQDFAPTKLYLRGKKGSPGLGNLNIRLSELTHIFETKGNITGVTATNNDMAYEFEMGMKGKSDPIVNIIVKDFPGEDLIKKVEKVNKNIEESEIVLLAIDATFLMEGTSALNEEMNKVELVTKYFKENPGPVKNKLVLLVPLKCEKYFHDTSIEEVSEKVSVIYAELINFFKENNIACAITPIQTLGDVEFDHFEDNITGAGVSKNAKYTFSCNNPKYQPMFCIQPLYYLLTYVSDYNNWLQKHGDGDWIEKIKRKILAMLMSNKDFSQEVDGLRRFMLTNTKGYMIVCGNTIWRTNND